LFDVYCNGVALLRLFDIAKKPVGKVDRSIAASPAFVRQHKARSC
jgi:hypothetical protein